MITPFFIRLAVRTVFRILFLWLIGLLSLAHAALDNLTEQQYSDYQRIVTQLSDVNEVVHTLDDIYPETYWVDAENGLDDISRTGQIDQPWQSITWAINNIPFSKNSANVIVRAGTYSPSLLYIGQARGGSESETTPFNLMAFPNERVSLDGRNVSDQSALFSISAASNVHIHGFDIRNLTGSGKSAIYVTDSNRVTLSNNVIHHSQWTIDAEAALSDRFNGIVVAGSSRDIEIKHNTLHDLITGYGEPLLVLPTANAVLTDNTLYDNDALMFENQQYFVSALGSDDKGDGSRSRPWKTLQKALFSIPYAEDNATINVREGRYQIKDTLYFESLRGGSEGKYFTIQAFEGESVIIDGGSIVQPFAAMVSLSSTAYVRIKGLAFTNLRGPKSAIYVDGNTHHIELLDNKLYDMTWVDENGENEASPSPSDNLNPIAVIGNRAETPIRSIVIRGNELFDIVPGYSEIIKIVGNVTDFTVENNVIRDVGNIGIVAAGNYTWVKDRDGVTIPAAVNHARDGVIRNNTVSYAISPVANSAGIYLDGAHNVLVENNTSHHNAVGFSVGCEQAGTTKGNVLKQNVAYGNIDAGLVIGTIHAGASVIDTTVEYNTLTNNYRKGGWGGEVTIQQTHALSLHNNAIQSRSDLMIVASQASTGLSIDNNQYFGHSADPERAIFDWGGVDETTYVSLSEFSRQTCHDINSVYQNVEAADYFATLAAKSAAMTDDSLKAHKLRQSGGSKRGHHGFRKGKKHAHQAGGQLMGECGSPEARKPHFMKHKHPHTHAHQHPAAH